MIDIYVVGCGGIGGYLLYNLPRTMASLCVDYSIDVYREENQDIMGQNGLSNNLHNPFSKLILIDGDVFDGHNSLRQAAAASSKLAVQMNNIRKDDAFTTWLNTTKLIGYNCFVTPTNIHKIFDVSETIGWNPHSRWLSGISTPVVFLCVDNHKTRYEISKWLERANNVLIINGGNSKTTGNVTVYERRDGTELDPPIYKLYPEINEKADLRPDETPCTEIASGNDQTAITNNIIANFMTAKFMTWFKTGGFDQKLSKRDKDGNNLVQRKNEVLIDLNTCTVMSMHHEKTVDNRKVDQIEDVQTQTR